MVSFALPKRRDLSINVDSAVVVLTKTRRRTPRYPGSEPVRSDPERFKNEPSEGMSGSVCGLARRER